MQEWKTNSSPKMAAGFVQTIYGDNSEETVSICITVGNPQGLYAMTDQDNVNLYIVKSQEEVVGKISLIRTADGKTLWMFEYDEKIKEWLENTLIDLKKHLQSNGWDVVDQNQIEKKVKSKRGPRTYSRERKIATRKKWDKLDRDEFPVTLEEFLEEEFGSTGGKLNVATSTFYDWPKE